MKKPKDSGKDGSTGTFNPVIIESKNCQTVVMMLHSEEVEVLHKACEAVAKFALKSDENKAQLHSLGTVQKLIPLISHEEKLVKRYACMAYALMVKNEDVRVALRKSDPDCIVSAIRLLDDDDEVCVEFACLFLSNMATDFVNKKIIRENGGVEPVIALVATSNDPDIQKNGLDCLSSLAEDYECREVLRDAGVVASLMERINSDYPAIQHSALKTLAVLVLDGRAAGQFRELEGLDKVIALLNQKFSDLHMVALSVVSNCLVGSPDSMEDLRNGGGLDLLISFVNENYPSLEVKLFAAQAIGRTARNERNASILHEHQVEQCLVALLNAHADADDIIIAVCHAMAVLATGNIVREAFGKIGAIPPLVTLLSCENAEVCEATCLALANLTMHNLNNSLEIVKANGGVESLVRSLKEGGSDLVKVGAASCMINMSAEISIREEIMGEGVIEAIATSLTSPNPMVQAETAQLLSSFADGSDARQQMMASEGLMKSLVSLLRSDDALVRRNVCHVIVRCAVDPQVAALLLKQGVEPLTSQTPEACEQGAGSNEEDAALSAKTQENQQPKLFVEPSLEKSSILEILRDINSSEERRMNCSLLAFDKLITANLPAKYSVVGKLSTTDVILDHFYDPGRIGKNDRFLPLEVLGKLPLHSNRETLVVNYKQGACERRNSKVSTSSRDEDESSRSKKKDEGRTSKQDKSSRKKKKDKDWVAREEQERLQREKEEKEREEREKKLKESQYEPPSDEKLLVYVEEVMRTIEPLPTVYEQSIALAQYVASCMGGGVERERVLEFGWQLHIAQLKFKFESNAVPLGEVKKGTYYHRALLYKVLADKIGIPCTLERGDYNLAWNVVQAAPQSLTQKPYRAFKYVVDLMHDPGRLIKAGSSQAHLYQTI